MYLSPLSSFTLVQGDSNKGEWKEESVGVGLAEMKLYYSKKVHTQPFHALLKILRPQGRVATLGRGEGSVVSNSNLPVMENPGLAVALGRGGSLSARLWKFYTKPPVHEDICVFYFFSFVENFL
jgi:hypothetical protein